MSNKITNDINNINSDGIIKSVPSKDSITEEFDLSGSIDYSDLDTNRISISSADVGKKFVSVNESVLKNGNLSYEIKDSGAVLIKSDDVAVGWTDLEGINKIVISNNDDIKTNLCSPGGGYIYRENDNKTDDIITNINTSYGNYIGKDNFYSKSNNKLVDEIKYKREFIAEYNDIVNMLNVNLDKKGWFGKGKTYGINGELLDYDKKVTDKGITYYYFNDEIFKTVNSNEVVLKTDKKSKSYVINSDGTYSVTDYGTEKVDKEFGTYEQNHNVTKTYDIDGNISVIELQGSSKTYSLNGTLISKTTPDAIYQYKNGSAEEYDMYSREKDDSKTGRLICRSDKNGISYYDSKGENVLKIEDHDGNIIQKNYLNGKPSIVYSPDKNTKSINYYYLDDGSTIEYYNYNDGSCELKEYYDDGENIKSITKALTENAVSVGASDNRYLTTGGNVVPGFHVFDSITNYDENGNMINIVYSDNSIKTFLDDGYLISYEGKNKNSLVDKIGKDYMLEKALNNPNYNNFLDNHKEYYDNDGNLQYIEMSGSRSNSEYTAVVYPNGTCHTEYKITNDNGKPQNITTCDYDEFGLRKEKNINYLDSSFTYENEYDENGTTIKRYVGEEHKLSYELTKDGGVSYDLSTGDVYSIKNSSGTTYFKNGVRERLVSSDGSITTRYKSDGETIKSITTPELTTEYFNDCGITRVYDSNNNILGWYKDDSLIAEDCAYSVNSDGSISKLYAKDENGNYTVCVYSNE